MRIEKTPRFKQELEAVLDFIVEDSISRALGNSVGEFRGHHTYSSAILPLFFGRKVSGKALMSRILGVV